MRKTTKTIITAIFKINKNIVHIGRRSEPTERLILADFSSSTTEVSLTQYIDENTLEAIETINHADFWENKSKYRITIEKLPTEF